MSFNWILTPCMTKSWLVLLYQPWMTCCTSCYTTLSHGDLIVNKRLVCRSISGYWLGGCFGKSRPKLYLLPYDVSLFLFPWQRLSLYTILCCLVYYHFLQISPTPSKAYLITWHMHIRIFWLIWMIVMKFFCLQSISINLMAPLCLHRKFSFWLWIKFPTHSQKGISEMQLSFLFNYLSHRRMLSLNYSVIISRPN